MVLVLTQIPINLTYAIFPQMSRAFHLGDTSRLFSLFRFNFQLMLLVGTMVALPFYLFRREFIINIYGLQFWPSAHMMGILMWTLPFGFLNTALGNLLASSDRQHSVNIATIVAAAFNVLINVIMIPRYGAIGSSWATFATEVTCCTALFGAVAIFHRGSLQLRKVLPLFAFQVAVVCLFVWIDIVAPSGTQLPHGASFRNMFVKGHGWIAALSSHRDTWIRLFCYLLYAAVCVWWGRALIRARRMGEQASTLAQ
jgi:O-antigen/teichoic acid export membrane protein